MKMLMLFVICILHVVFTEQHSHGPHLNMGQMGIFLTFAQIMLLVAGSNCDATASVAIQCGNNTKKKEADFINPTCTFQPSKKTGLSKVLLEINSQCCWKQNTAQLQEKKHCGSVCEIWLFGFDR